MDLFGSYLCEPVLSFQMYSPKPLKWIISDRLWFLWPDTYLRCAAQTLPLPPAAEESKPQSVSYFLMCASLVDDATGRKALTPRHGAAPLTELAATSVFLTLCTCGLSSLLHWESIWTIKRFPRCQGDSTKAAVKSVRWSWAPDRPVMTVDAVQWWHVVL